MNYFSKTLYMCLCMLFFLISLSAQNITLDRVEPPNWWVGMKNSQVQLLVYGKNISSAIPTIHYEGVVIKSSTTLENPNYLFVTLDIKRSAKPGAFELVFRTPNNKELIYNYVLSAKRNKSAKESSVNPSDVMYLITPVDFLMETKVMIILKIQLKKR